ncbi:MAG TPA: sugar transferase [Clostridia bacterium]
MHKLNRLAYKNVLQLVLDIGFIFISFFVSYLICLNISKIGVVEDYVWILVLFVPIFVYTMSFLEMYNKTTFNYFDRIFKNVIIASLISSVLIYGLYHYIKNIPFHRYMYFIFLILTILTSVFERYALYLVIKSRNHNSNSSRVIIAGVQSVINKFIYYLKKTQIDMNIVGYVQLDEKWPLNSEGLLGNITELEDILKKNFVDEVIFALPKESINEMENHVLICESMGVTARMVLNLYDLKVAKIYLTSIGTLPMLTFHTVCLNEVQLLAKRILDIIGAVIGLILTAVLSIVVIPAIKLDSPGPVIFSQERVGHSGRHFRIYKFRSMYVDAEERKAELLKQNKYNDGYMFKMQDDPRVTRVGRFLRKTSIDELLQFINVLKGDMSLVGTRPPTVDEVVKYEAHHFRRISIKPGITGLWQVSGRSEITDFDEVVKLDTDYIDKWSVGLDIKILLKTFIVILKRKGAF